MATVLSIRQPWAELIVSGLKPVENRTWETKVRGEVFIHAGKTKPDTNLLFDIFRRFGVRINPDLLHYGGIIGKANLVACVTEHPSPYFEGDFGFVLKDACRLPFRPLSGKLGFFFAQLD